MYVIKLLYLYEMCIYVYLTDLHMLCSQWIAEIRKSIYLHLLNNTKTILFNTFYGRIEFPEYNL